MESTRVLNIEPLLILLRHDSQLLHFMIQPRQRRYPLLLNSSASPFFLGSGKSFMVIMSHHGTQKAQKESETLMHSCLISRFNLTSLPHFIFTMDSCG